MSATDDRPAVCRVRGCDATVPVCPGCGHRWEYMSEPSDGRLYTSALVVAKYGALYGAPPVGFFVAVSA